MRQAMVSLVVVSVLLTALFAADGPADPQELLKLKVGQAVFGPTLKDAFAQYARLTALKVQPDWAALKAAGAGENRPVRLEAAGVTAAQLMDLLLAQAAEKGQPLSWYADRDGLHVSTQMRVLHRNSLLRPVVTSGPAAAAAPVVATEFSFDQVPIEKVIGFFRDLSGVNIVVNWRSLEQVGLARDTLVTLKATGIPTARALDLVMDQLSAGKERMERVYWVVDEGVVNIATGAALNTVLKVHVLDVADLVMDMPSVPRSNLASAMPSSPGGVQGGGNSGNVGTVGTGASLFIPSAHGGNAAQLNTPDNRGRQAEDLMNLIKDMIGQDMWQPLGKGSIRIVRGQLIITQTPLGFKLLDEAMRSR